MKKVLFLLLSLALAAPALGMVTITVTPGPGPNDVTVGFISDEPNNVRMFNLDITITVDDPCITIADVNCVNPDYAIYPGSITIDQNGFVTDYGTCAGNPSQGPDGGTQPGLESNGVTIEMGSLYAEGEPPPAQAGDLVIITLGGCVSNWDAPVPVTFGITENIVRGGVIMENPYEVVTVDCFSSCEVYFEPLCPGCPCWGDIAGSTGPDPDYVVNTADLAKLLDLLGPLGDASPPYEVCPVPFGFECMDIAGSTGPDPDGCINTADLGKLLGYLGPLAGASPPYTAPCMPP